MRINRCDINLVAIERNTAVGRMQLQHLGRNFFLVAPQLTTGSGVDCDQLRAGRGDVHVAIVDDGRRLMTFRHAGRERPGELQLVNVARIDLFQWAVAPARIVTTVLQPVARFRVG